MKVKCLGKEVNKLEIKYKLNKNIYGRAAVQLNWALSQLESIVQIRGARAVNGKSLVGLLSGNFRLNDIINIYYDKESDVEKIKEALNEVGVEING